MKNLPYGTKEGVNNLMDATKGNIYAILNGNKQFLIPVYQRYYSWETEQCSRLWNDIVDMQKKDKVVSLAYPL